MYLIFKREKLSNLTVNSQIHLVRMLLSESRYIHFFDARPVKLTTRWNFLNFKNVGVLIQGKNRHYLLKKLLSRKLVKLFQNLKH